MAPRRGRYSNFSESDSCFRPVSCIAGLGAAGLRSLGAAVDGSWAGHLQGLELNTLALGTSPGQGELSGSGHGGCGHTGGENSQDQS